MNTTLRRAEEYYLIPLAILNLVLLISVSLNYTYTGLIFIGLLGFLFLLRYPILALAATINGSYIFYLVGEPFDKTDALTLAFKGAIFLGLLILWWRFSVKLDILRNPIIISSLVLGLLLIIGIKYSSAPMYGYTKTQHYFLVNFLILCTVSFLCYNIKNIEKLLILIAFFGVILGLSAMLKMFLGLETTNRLTIFDINAIWVSRAAGFSIIVIFYLYKNRSISSFFKFVYLFSAFVLFITMIFTVSRGPMLALFLVSTFYYLFFSKQPLSQKATIATVVLAIMVVTLLFLPEQIIDRFSHFGSRKDLSGMMRMIWVSKILPVIKSKYLVGIGTGGFSKLIMGVDMRAYPHNLFAEIGLENGIIGLTVLGLFLYYTVKYCKILVHKNMERPNILNLAIFALMVFFFALFNSMFSGDISGNEQIWFAAGIIAGLHSYS